MIVDPDFPDHWKTRLLVDSLDGDEAGPVYLLRLWAHCQNRRTAAFEALPCAALKALCRYPGHANKLESALSASGFVRREDQHLIVIGWEEYNASLIANWKNGSLGGRPKKPVSAGKNERRKPIRNPSETHGFSMGIPSVTHGEPIREEKIGEEIPPESPRGDGEADGPRVLPKGWKQMSKADQKRTSVIANSPTMIRIGKWFNRREGTLWTVAEAVALLQVHPTPEDIDLIGDYYEAEILKDDDIRRKSLETLLNNWSGERDRANVWRAGA